MRRVTAGLGSLVAVAGLATTFALSAGAAPPEQSRFQPARPVVDDLPDATEAKRREMREVAIKKVLAGKLKVKQRGASEVAKVGRTTAIKGQPAEDQYVELAREKTDKIFVVLAEFGNERDPAYPDQDTDPSTPGPTRFDGPLHNQIPEPDRTKDNRTIWEPNYNRAHFQKLYFGTGANDNSVKEWYEKQSSGRYSVDGTVTDWVKVRFNEARYGRSNGFPCDAVVCSNSEDLVRDALNAWVDGQKRAGKTDAQIAASLKSFDQWDRNDYDHDGNFNEPDGYIDHFQIVHAGGDQADGDPYQGEDAIWSHRSKVYIQDDGKTGPAFNKDGGTPVGNTGLWVADYTMQPENGGVSVFAHEYAHDLGLPDEYDTAAATGTQENAVNWWSIMAQSRQSAPGEFGLGTRASDFGAWDKLQLGWLDYEVVPAGQNKTLDLGPHEYNTAKAQGVVVPLGKKTVVTDFGAAPFAGTKQWWSGQGDDYESSLTRQVTLPAGPASLTFQARWNIEDCGSTACDYAFVEVNDGSGFKAIPGSITNPSEGNGIDGDHPEWTPATFDLSAYAGKTISLRLRYKTDGAARGTDATKTSGIYADEFALTAGGQTVFTDGAENGANGWTVDKFKAVGQTLSEQFDHYYIASNRQYVSYDQYLKSGPYNAADPARPLWFEHFPYQNGMIVSYWDTSFSDNNESVHPGQGEILAIDSHPDPIFRLDGVKWRPRIQTYDAPFSLEKADSFTLHMPNGQPSYIRGQDAVPVFDDRRSYWNAQQPNVGVKVPNAGVRIAVQKQDGTSMRIRISSTKPAT
jgi:immune inhibitor A